MALSKQEWLALEKAHELRNLTLDTTIGRLRSYRRRYVRSRFTDRLITSILTSKWKILIGLIATVASFQKVMQQLLMLLFFATRIQ